MSQIGITVKKSKEELLSGLRKENISKDLRDLKHAIISSHVLARKEV
jgi:hypothetical protein